jgi:hyperosmotically inducible periplasmic protein
MKKLIPFLISGALLVGTVGCNSDSKTAETTTGADSSAVKEAGQKTQGNGTTTIDKTATGVKTGVDKTTTGIKTGVDKTTTGIKAAAGGGVKTIIKNKLDKQFPGSNLDVSQTGDVLTISGTVPDEATRKKIEPAVKEYKLQGFKTVKLDATVAPKKAQ